MDTRTVVISLQEQSPKARTLKFLPDTTGSEGELLLNKYYSVTTEDDGTGSISLPVKSSGTIRYKVNLPTPTGTKTFTFYLSAGADVDLSDLIAAGGAATDTALDYVNANAVKYSGAQSLSNEQKTQARANIGATSGGSSIGAEVEDATPGSVLFADEDGNLAEDDRFYFSNGVLKLLDKDYVPFAGSLDADVLFAVGSNDNVQNNPGTIETTNHFVGSAFDLKIVASGADKWLFGQMSQFRMSGSITGSPPIFGYWLQVCNRGLNGGTPTVEAAHYSVNLEGAAAEAGGLVGEAYRGSNVACPIFFGVRGIAGNGYANATEANGGDFFVKTVSEAATIALARGVWAHAELGAGHSVTTLRGVSVDGIESDAAIDHSVGVFIDESIDLGTESKFAIKSLSTSPSLFSGPVSVPREAYGAGWEDSDESAAKGDLFNVVENLVAGALGYDVYAGILVQSGTNDPVSTVLDDTIGDIVWTRTGVGTYTGTLAGAFPANKTIILTSRSSLSTAFIYEIGRNDDNTIFFNSYDIDTNAVDFDSSLSIRIEVYP